MNDLSHRHHLVYAVVVNWNRPVDTLECLDSLARQEGIIPRLLVVDNGSSDGSAAIIKQRFPSIEMITSNTNLGFAKGANLGLRHALSCGADFIFLMNNDTTIARNSLKIMMEYAAPQTGILAPMIYYTSMPDTIWSIGGRTNPWTLEKSNDAVNSRDTGMWPEVIEQDFITGCGMLFPRHTLEKVGLFDERFQMYYEDSDLCYRVLQAGLNIIVIPKAKMWHKVSVSSGGSGSPNERYWMGKSSLIFFRKYARGWQWLIIGPYRLGSALKTTLRLARAGRYSAMKAYWRGLRDGLLDIGDSNAA